MQAFTSEHNPLPIALVGGPAGSASLPLLGLQGLGTFSAGTLTGVFDLESPSLFPVHISGPYNASANVTYTYEPIGSEVPEPASLLLIGTGLPGSLTARRRRQIR